MKIPNDYVVVPQDTILIPRKEYDYLRDEWAEMRFTIVRLRDWVTAEYILESKKSYSHPETATTEISKLAILLGLDLSHIRFISEEPNKEEKEVCRHDNL